MKRRFNYKLKVSCSVAIISVTTTAKIMVINLRSFIKKYIPIQFNNYSSIITIQFNNYNNLQYTNI